MDKKYIEQHDIVERFILNQLSPEELDQFLVYQMLHPEVREEVQHMREMISSIRHSAKHQPEATTGKKNYVSARSGIILVLILFYGFRLYRRRKQRKAFG